MELGIIRRWFEQNYVMYLLLGIGGAGLLVKIIVAGAYHSLLRASDNMGESKHKLMKLLRMKFETCYKLKIGIKNVDSFVDKYIYKYKFMGILLYTWESIGGQVLIIAMLAGAIAVVFSIVSGCGQFVMLSTLLVSIGVCALLVTVEGMINLPMKKKVLRVNIVDYLDNFLKARLENEYFHGTEMKEYYQEYFDQGEVGTPDGKQEDDRENSEPFINEENNNSDMEERTSEQVSDREDSGQAEAAITREIDEGMLELIDSLLQAAERKEKGKNSLSAQATVRSDSRKKKRDEQRKKAKEDKIIQEVLREYLGTL